MSGEYGLLLNESLITLKNFYVSAKAKKIESSESEQRLEMAVASENKQL